MGFPVASAQKQKRYRVEEQRKGEGEGVDRAKAWCRQSDKGERERDSKCVKGTGGRLKKDKG